MDIRLHVGAHRSGTQHLRQMLEGNRDLLEAQGICLPDVGRAEKAFAKALRGVREKQPVGEVNAKLLSMLTGDKTYRRIVLIDPNISGSLSRPVGKEFFYPRIVNSVTRILECMDGVPVRLFVSTRNPATFIPSCYAESLKTASEVTFEKFIEDTNLPRLRWSDYLHRAQLRQQEMGLTAWRFEDYPYIWRDVAQAITGIENKESLVGSPSPINAGVSLRGAILMQSYLQDHPVKKASGFQRVRAAFEAKFPSVRNEVYNPTWPMDLTTGMTENYEDDWYYIERMENIEVIHRHAYL